MGKAIQRWAATREAIERRKGGFGTDRKAWQADREAAWWRQEADEAWAEAQS